MKNQSNFFALKICNMSPELMQNSKSGRRRSWRTRKNYFYCQIQFSQLVLHGIRKSFGGAIVYNTKMGNIWRSFWYVIILLSAVCSCQGDINPRNLLLNSRYTTPPKIGLDWLNKNGSDALADIIKKKNKTSKTWFYKSLPQYR